ncbi:SCO1860 family LAETG-anchored protein, partial [Streptomyces sp. CBMA291]
MNSNTFRMPVRRTATAATVAALAVGPVLLAAPAAQATGGEGRATAVVLRAGLDVSLLGKTVNVPVRVALNEVTAPQTESETALAVKVRGAEDGKPIDIITADVATSKATVDKEKSEGYVNLVKARVHVPGIPLLPLIEVEKVTSKALCETGRKPVAESNVLGHVTVLGTKTTLTAGGTTHVAVPGVGAVTLDLSRTTTTSRTAAATALELKVKVNPGELGVAKVDGTVTLAEATCETPHGTKPTPQPTGTPTKPTPQPTEPTQQPGGTTGATTGGTGGNGGSTAGNGGGTGGHDGGTTAGNGGSSAGNGGGTAGNGDGGS